MKNMIGYCGLDCEKCDAYPVGYYEILGYGAPAY